MCGIFGYVGAKNAVPIVLSGLKRLEYRGYDSAGFAGIKNGSVIQFKEAGKVNALEKLVVNADIEIHTAITHTRWATHGRPSHVNAHPHMDAHSTLAVVHNGIIENFESLRKQLREKGIQFLSETDTEVIAHLISNFYEGDLLKAIQKAVPLLKGAYAIAVVHKDYPNQIVAVAHEAPLVIGIGQNEAFLSSDTNAFAAHTKEVVFLSNAEIAIIRPDKLEIFDAGNSLVNKKSEQLQFSADDSSKGSFTHYTLKEIFEQPQAIRNACLSRYVEEFGTAMFEELTISSDELKEVERILILACGSSWHAGYIASYLMEDLARLPVQVEISSEFRYKNPVVPKGTLAIAISQSGETADTIAALRELKAKGVKILGICNVQSSTLAREADSTIFLRAGPEIGVCSTKAFTSQVVTLALFALLMARMRHMGKQEGQEFIHALQKLPEQVKQVLDQSKHIAALAKKYQRFQDFFFIGRRYMYPTALEGALKLKEISYINANGYPAGELKHGPIALINEEVPTVALTCNASTQEKILSNIMEVKARNGRVIAIADQSSHEIEQVVDDIIFVPKTIDPLAAIPTTVATQLLAFYIAQERGEDIDQPRNLAKSVTVE